MTRNVRSDAKEATFIFPWVKSPIGILSHFQEWDQIPMGMFSLFRNAFILVFE